jgi:hypothetical protein
MGRDYKASVSPGKAHQVLKLLCPVVLLLKRGRSAIADLPSCDFRCWLYSHAYKPSYLGVSTVTMSRNQRTSPDEEPSPSGSTGCDGSARIRWHKMSPMEAVARDVYCAPIAITGLEHLPRHIPKKRFDELCEDRDIPIYANAVRIIRLWNSGQRVATYELAREAGTDIPGYTAWCLEEEVGPDNFWTMLRQQASPPIQTDRDLFALWIVARDRRTEEVKARAEAYFRQAAASP